MPRPISLEDASSTEQRAAHNFARITGATVKLEDTGLRNGAVDLSATYPNGEVHIIEVTSTLDADQEKYTREALRFMAAAEEAYTGSAAWLIGFRRGWRAQTGRSRAGDGRLLATHLIMLEQELETGTVVWGGEEIKLPNDFGFDELYISLIDLKASESGLHPSFNAGVREDSSPFCERLERYLLRSAGIQRKRKKLVLEAERLGATARHLYLSTTPTGAWSSLGIFQPRECNRDIELPDGVDSVWIEGPRGVLAVFQRDVGWKTHDLHAGFDLFEGVH